MYYVKLLIRILVVKIFREVISVGSSISCIIKNGKF